MLQEAKVIAGYDYQEHTVRKVIPELWRKGYRAPILVSPIGSGKTRMSAMLAQEIWARDKADFWHIAHRTELITQPWRLYQSFGIPCHAITAGKQQDTSYSVHTASIQTLIKRPIVPTHKFCVVSVDEAHRAVGAQHVAMVEKFKEVYGPDNVWVIHWTATPYRLDGRSMGDVADYLYEVTTPADLFARGTLMEPQIFGADDPRLTAGMHHRMGEFIAEEKAERFDTARVVGNVIDSWVKFSSGMPSIYFGVNVPHSQHMTEKFKEVGVRALHLDGKSSPLERKRGMLRLAIGGRGSNHPEAIDVICNVGLFGEGFDSEMSYQAIHDADCRDLWLGKSYPPEYQPLGVLGDVDPTESCCQYRQREGRVCRTHPTKTKAIVISHSGNYRRHGLLRHHYGFELDEHIGEKLKKRARVSVFQSRHCPACLSVWPAEVKVCSCGQNLKPANLPEADESIQLRLVAEAETPRVAPPNPREERAFLKAMWAKWRRLCVTNRASGKPPPSDKMVTIAFKNKFGHWPASDLLSSAKKLEE